MSLLSLLINLMYICLIKLFISFKKKNLTGPVLNDTLYKYIYFYKCIILLQMIFYLFTSKPWWSWTYISDGFSVGSCNTEMTHHLQTTVTSCQVKRCSPKLQTNRKQTSINTISENDSSQMLTRKQKVKKLFCQKIVQVYNTAEC